MMKLETDFLFHYRCKLAPPIQSVGTPNGHRMVVIGTSGIVEGPRIKGRILPHSGGDWALIRADGTGALDVRLSVETDDGAIILMTYFGRMAASEENVNYALDFAKPDDPAGVGRYYFRILPLFETGDERYTWLNQIVTVGVGRTGDDSVIYDVYEVK